MLIESIIKNLDKEFIFVFSDFEFLKFLNLNETLLRQ